MPSYGNLLFKAAEHSYKSDKYVEASAHFFRSVLAAKKSRNMILERKSEWGLAQSLTKMRLYYSASMYLSKIVRRGFGTTNPFFKRALEGLGKINGRVNLGQSHIVQLFKTKINPANIPGPARGFYFYYKGVEAFGNKKYKSAQSLFKRVQPSAQYYVKALFHLGVIANISGKHMKGIKNFSKVSALSEVSNNGAWLQEQANLNIARIYYEMKRYRDAISYYAEIPRESDNWLQALFEASWAFFIMERANNTLGNIHTLHSPFFENRFFPESYILQAVTFLRLCRFDRVKESMKLFKKRYRPVLKNIKALIKKSEKRPRRFFKFVYDYRTGSLKSHRNVWAILDALSRTDTYKQAGSTIKNADQELARLSQAPQNWASVGLLKALRKFLVKKKRAALNDSGKRLYRLGVGFHRYLVELSNQTRLITAELLLGKVDKLRSKLNIKSPGKKGNFIGGMKALKIGQDLEYWPFEGEYWEDELGGYVYNINSQCNKKNRRSKKK